MDFISYYWNTVTQTKSAWDHPATHTFVSIPTLTNEKEIMVIPHPPKHHIEMHSHDFFELIYVYRGNCINQVDQKSLTLYEGDLCMLNTHASHNLTVSQPEQTCIFNILVSSTIVDNAHFQLISSEEPVSTFFLDSIQNHRQEQNYVLFRRSGLQSPYEAAVQRIIEEYANPQIYQKEMLYFSFISLLVELTRSYGLQINNASGSHSLSEIMQYITENCATISVNSLAERFNYHPKYIPSLIRKYSGQSFTELLTGIRIKKAASLLEHTDRSVTQIMESVGYSNRTWFVEKFKKKYHVTPSQYRQRVKNNGNPTCQP